jgi:carbon starvation protein
MLIFILLLALGLFALAYGFYGRFLSKRFDIDDNRSTPSHTTYDGVDRVPAQRMVLLGHHFSSIAGAGPIIGPVIASVAFGWLPVLLWIILGSIFIGGVHDFASLIASIRHRARSIAEIAREYMSTTAYKLFLAFIWLTLVYVLTVFADLTSATFVQNGGVATSSIIYIMLAIGFGLSIYRLKLPILWSSFIFVPLIFAGIWIGQLIPFDASILTEYVNVNPAKIWSIILIAYCFIASVTPVWILLQPRDYLSSYLLYASVIAGLVGILFGGFSLHFPAFNAYYVPAVGSVFPILFITVACGACSGFHSIVASGTSSKQLNKETDARMVGYGAMLIEGLVAVIALSTVAIMIKGDVQAIKEPLQIYGLGMGKFLSVLGLPHNIGVSFGLLALSTFILTTLDTATRLGRYIFEEFFNIKEPRVRYFTTLATLTLPTIFVLLQLKDANGNLIPAWKAIWPVFGATNQLLAGLALLVIVVWMKKQGKKTVFVFIPMVFMVVMTVWALTLLVSEFKFNTIGIIAAALLILAVLLIREAITIILKLYRKTSG